VEELVESVTVFPDHLEVTIHGAPPPNVLHREVRIKVSEIVGVRDPKQQICYQALATATDLTVGLSVESSRLVANLAITKHQFHGVEGLTLQAPAIR
jgi:hypothetical protein